MWRLGKYLSGQCIYTDQEVSFIGGIAAKIQNIYISGKKACFDSCLKETSADMLVGLLSLHDFLDQGSISLFLCENHHIYPGVQRTLGI